MWRAVGGHIALLLALAPNGLPIASLADAVMERVSLASVLESRIDLVGAAPVIAQFIVMERVQQSDHFAYVTGQLVRPMHARVAPLFAKYVHDERSTVNADVRLFSMSGTLASCAAARSYLIWMAPAATDNDVLRSQLKAAIVHHFLPQQRGNR